MAKNGNNGNRRLEILEKAYLQDRERWAKSEEFWKKSDERWVKSDEFWKKSDERWAKNDERWAKNDERISKMLKVLQHQQRELLSHKDELKRLGERTDATIRMLKRHLEM